MSSSPWLGWPIKPCQDSNSLFAFTVLVLIGFQIQIHQSEPFILRSWVFLLGCICRYIFSRHWKILWGTYRQVAWVGFESTTTAFCSDALTDWAINQTMSSTRTQRPLCTASSISWSDYPILGAEIARARKRFWHPLLISKPVTMT